MALVRSSQRDAWTARLVWSVWAALAIAALGLALELGFRIPFWDDWDDMVPFYAGVLRVDAATLWHPHNEHHIPLSRLILIGLGRATDHDLRAGALLSVAALSAASALLLRSARAVDGRLRLADCALPLLLLHWGHYMTLLWSYQVHAALLALFACALLMLILSSPEPPSARATLTYGSCLLSLPLCQAGGIALAPALAAWLALVGVLAIRSTRARRGVGWVALVLAGSAVALAAVAYVDPRFETSGDPARVTWWSAVMLSTAFGMTEREAPFTWLLPAATAALLLATGVLVVRVLWVRPGERLRALGLGLFLAAFLGLALGIGWGRHEHSLSTRYPVLAAPLACALYLAWRRYGPGRSGAWVCAGMCAAVAALTPWNTTNALRFARKQDELVTAFERDARAGAPVERLVSKYVPAVQHQERVFRRGLVQMRDAGIGVFRTIRQGR